MLWVVSGRIHSKRAEGDAHFGFAGGSSFAVFRLLDCGNLHGVRTGLWLLCNVVPQLVDLFFRISAPSVDRAVLGCPHKNGVAVFLSNLEEIIEIALPVAYGYHLCSGGRFRSYIQGFDPAIAFFFLYRDNVLNIFPAHAPPFMLGTQLTYEYLLIKKSQRGSLCCYGQACVHHQPIGIDLVYVFPFLQGYFPQPLGLGVAGIDEITGVLKGEDGAVICCAH